MISPLMILLVGLDNFVVCAGLGSVRWPRNRKLMLVSGFMIAEMTMPLLGFTLLRSALAPAEWLAWLEPLSLVVIGSFVVAGLLIATHVLKVVKSAWPIFALPPLMALDNFIAGASVPGDSLLTGLWSALACLTGLWFGETIQRRASIAPVENSQYLKSKASA